MDRLESPGLGASSLNRMDRKWIVVENMAERMGFEPMMQVSPHTRLAGERLQPTRPSLRDLKGQAFAPIFG